MHLLLVDDEASLLQLLGQHLTRQGHSVESASSVAEARPLLDRSFDAAIIDWSLPDGNGLDIGRALLEPNRPNKPNVIFTSGYPLDDDLVPAHFRSRVRFLQKPFLPRALAEILNSL